MYCTFCGRTYTNNCSCINENKPRNIDKIFLLLLITIFPMFTFTVTSVFIVGNSTFNYYEVASITLGFIMILAVMLDLIFKTRYLPILFGCHQRSDRSFRVTGRLLPICARCTGILIGVILSYLLTFIPISFYFFLLLSIPLLIDGILQKTTTYRSTNIKRFITGLLFAPTLVIIFGAIHYILYQGGYYLYEVIV